MSCMFLVHGLKWRRSPKSHLIGDQKPTRIAIDLGGGFVKTGGPNLETSKYSRQGDNREARNRRRCARFPSIARKTWQLPHFWGNVVEPRIVIWYGFCRDFEAM